MSKTHRPFYLFLLAVVLLNTLLWLDSFDRYLSSRYHITLSATLPEPAFALSRQTQDLIANTQQFALAKAVQLLTLAQHTDELDLPKLTAKVGTTALALQTNEVTSPSPDTAPTKPATAVAPSPAVASAPVVASAPAPVVAPAAIVAHAPVVAPVVVTPDAVVTPAPVAVVAPSPVIAPAPAVVAATVAAPAATTASIASASSVPMTQSSTAITNKQPAADATALPVTFPKVLFAGDSMMQGVAPLVINQLRKENSKGVFVDLSAQSTGLTVRRYFDWPTKIKDETLSRGFELVAIFLGPNDPWDIYEGTKRYVFGTPEWEDKYRDRVIEVMQFAQERQVHVIWIGLPNMKEERVKRGAIVQNKIFKEQASQFNFDYLSTEDLLGALDEPFKKFVDEPGKGQVMLRADDGIHFTQAGLRLISARLYELIKKQAKP